MTKNLDPNLNLNLDLEETQHFSEMAEDWWNPTGSCRPLHDLNPVRLQFITDRTDVYGKKILAVNSDF